MNDITRNEVLTALEEMAKRRVNITVITRIVTYLLLLGGVYLFLVSVSRIIPLSFFTFNLILFCSLSAFPFFLFFIPGKSLLKDTIRSVDTDCIIETYLSTKKSQIRMFTEKRAVMLTARLETKKYVRFRFSTLHIYQITINGALILFLAVFSFWQNLPLSLTYGKPESASIRQTATIPQELEDAFGTLSPDQLPAGDETSSDTAERGQLPGANSDTDSEVGEELSESLSDLSPILETQAEDPGTEREQVPDESYSRLFRNLEGAMSFRDVLNSSIDPEAAGSKIGQPPRGGKEGKMRVKDLWILRSSIMKQFLKLSFPKKEASS